MGERAVTDAQELAIRRQADEVVKRVLKGTVPFDFASPRLQAIVVGAESPEKVGKKKRDIAEERRQLFEDWYRQIGSFITFIPKPMVSNREFVRRAQAGQVLFYRHATDDVSYEDFMKAVGQGDHLTVTDNAERAKIVWEPTETGYWFWAETSAKCPRLKTPWNTLITTITRLINLEEYAIVWWVCREAGETLDISTWSWTRTCYNVAAAGEPERLGALRVTADDGKVYVHKHDPEHLEVSYDHEGGRSAEVVKNAA